MLEANVPLLISWANFYVVVGTAAASLTGLMFVVVTLVASIRRQRSGNPFGAFSTPNVVHFCTALLIAATFNAPWPALWAVSLLLGIVGVVGTAYIVIVIQRLRRPSEYQPVLEDWVWHGTLPLVSYLAFVITAFMLLSYPAAALFIVGAATILLLFIGIHNSWDTVTYVIVEFANPDNKDSN